MPNHLDNVLSVKDFWFAEPLVLDFMVPFPASLRHSKKEFNGPVSPTFWRPRVFVARLQ